MKDVAKSYAEYRYYKTNYAKDPLKSFVKMPMTCFAWADTVKTPI